MSLAGTTWQITGSSPVDKWNMTFNDDGTVLIKVGSAAPQTGYYCEGSGDFIIQEPHTTGNPNIGTVWSGSYVSNVGHGHIQTFPGGSNPNHTVLLPFSMIQQ